MAKAMKCPHCRVTFLENFGNSYRSYKMDGVSFTGLSVAHQLCPSVDCGKLIVVLEKGAFQGGGNLRSVASQELIYPSSPDYLVAPEVPEDYKKDFEEATTVLEFSPKASAALSRRLLQMVLQQKLHIREKNLSLEIQKFIDLGQAPAYLTAAIDAVRNIGNFAAHPLKNERTGQIVDVEDGEAEWLLEVIQSLFDFLFVQPAKLQQRQDKLNAKLQSLGKPFLKTV